MQAQRAIIRETGMPSVIQWETIDLPGPAAGEVLVRHDAIGVNFIDTYHRRGIYPIDLPSGLGMEAAGRVVAVGAGVTDLKEGDRVATFGPEPGAYATARLYRADILFKLPDAIDDELAAAAMLKACTTEFLVERCARVQAGWPVLVYAAAGGVGLMLVQWLKHVGATVIGTVSTPQKADLAKAAGADHVLIYGQEPVAPQIRALTGGAGVRVTFDGVGMATWETSLEATGERGLIINYGNADAPVGGVNLGVLAMKGSLFNTRPMLYHYYADPVERAAGAARIWDMLTSGALKITIGQRYPLVQVAIAHTDMEARRTVGSTVLLP